MHPGTRPLTAALAISLLTGYVLAVHGYHSYSEDGGLYLAGVEKLLNPALFPHDTAFVTEHLRFSLFAPTVAAVVHVTHRSLPVTVFVLYLLSVLTTLSTAWMLAASLRKSFSARLGAVSLLACWMVLPVAGTSLMLTDPYLTARSCSTPLTLLALAWTIKAEQANMTRSRWRFRCGVAAALAAAAVFHPLMAAYALAAVVCLTFSQHVRRGSAPWILAGLAIAVAAVIQARAPAESADYIRIAMTRYYWFPLRWQWYEQLGLLAPLLVLSLFRRSAPSSGPLARSAVWLGSIATSVSLLFCRAALATHLVARLQPLRSFTTVYLVMIVLLGAWLGERILKAHLLRWTALYAVFAALMFFVARSTYPASAHLELPFGAESVTPRNPWERAFLWSATHTSTDALFALDAHYITRDGEDAQLFRAIAQRSSLPDYSKDGGEASITPSLTPSWVRGQTAQTGLELASDATRYARLAPLGVTWIVLEQQSVTAMPCPYRNQAVKVCRLMP